MEEELRKEGGCQAGEAGQGGGCCLWGLTSGLGPGIPSHSQVVSRDVFSVEFWERETEGSPAVAPADHGNE